MSRFQVLLDVACKWAWPIVMTMVAETGILISSTATPAKDAPGHAYTV